MNGRNYGSSIFVVRNVVYRPVISRIVRNDQRISLLGHALFLVIWLLLTVNSSLAISQTYPTTKWTNLVAPIAVNSTYNAFYSHAFVNLPSNASVYNSDGTVASSTIHVTSAEYVIAYFPQVPNPPNGPATQQFQPVAASADQYGNPTFQLDANGKEFFYLVCKITFDSTSWNTLDSKAGVGLQCINALNNDSGGFLPVDSFASYTDTLSQLFTPTIPVNPSDTGFLWFYLDWATSGASLSDPYTPASSDPLGSTFYTDSHSAYFIFTVEAVYTAPFGNGSGSWPQTPIPPSGNPAYLYYAPALWIYNNPDASDPALSSRYNWLDYEF
jgi:hypothetical protein